MPSEPRAVAGQADGQGHTEDQVGKGGDHELDHQGAAAEDAVRYQLDRYQEVEGRHNPQNRMPVSMAVPVGSFMKRKRS